MSDWVTRLTVGEIAAIVGALLVVAGIVRKCWSPVRNFFRFIDDVTGEPARPGHDAKPGLMERLAVVEGKQDRQGKAIDDIHHETHTNSGGSLKDGITRIERGLADHIGLSQADREDLRRALVAHI